MSAENSNNMRYELLINVIKLERRLFEIDW